MIASRGAQVGAVAAAPNLFTKLTYDPEKDLVGVGMVMFAPYILAVHPSVPVKTVAELDWIWRTFAEFLGRLEAQGTAVMLSGF